MEEPKRLKDAIEEILTAVRELQDSLPPQSIHVLTTQNIGYKIVLFPQGNIYRVPITCHSFQRYFSVGNIQGIDISFELQPISDNTFRFTASLGGNRGINFDVDLFPS